MRVLVIGANLKEERYSNKAIRMLNRFEHDVLAIGLRIGIVDGTSIITNKENFDSVDTVTLYLNAARQPEFYDYIIKLNPRRVIFNPGTENEDLYHLLERANIEYENSCTLVLLQTGLF